MTDYPKHYEQVVYRFYDEYGATLYIGVTQNFKQRMRRHHSTKPWIGEVELMDWTIYPDRESAERAEAEAIELENPKYNIARIAPYVDEVAEALNHPRYYDLREMVE